MFTVVIPETTLEELQPFALFMFCGILPVDLVLHRRSTEAAGSLISGGNLIKKVLFPAEVLPIVSVLANMVHFFLGLPILDRLPGLLQRHRPDPLGSHLVSRSPCSCSSIFTTALALILAALTVHFRDIRDILGERADAVVLRDADHLPWIQESVRDSAARVSTSTRSPIWPLRIRRSCSSGQIGHWQWLLALGGASVVAASGRLLGVRSPEGFLRAKRYDEGHRARGRLEGVPALRRQAVRDAQERAAPAQHPARSAAERDVSRRSPTSRSAVPKGSTYGVIGRNGSGKSTALKLVAGITKPTSGTVRVDGRISRADRAGRRLPPEISGPRERLHQRHHARPDEAARSRSASTRSSSSPSSREFIDAPVKTYSSGMYMRLGFAVAIHVDPDVLLVDEVLAVGDEGFTHKCLDKFAEFRRRGKTILLVTHSLNLVERFCDEALWLDGGRALSHGDPKRVVGAYLTSVEAVRRAAARGHDRKTGRRSQRRPRRRSSRAARRRRPAG